MIWEIVTMFEQQNKLLEIRSKERTLDRQLEWEKEKSRVRM